MRCIYFFSEILFTVISTLSFIYMDLIWRILVKCAIFFYFCIFIVFFFLSLHVVLPKKWNILSSENIKVVLILTDSLDFYILCHYIFVHSLSINTILFYVINAPNLFFFSVVFPLSWFLSIYIPSLWSPFFSLYLAPSLFLSLFFLYITLFHSLSIYL